MPLAPIALFTFRRPEHTRRTLAALANNPEFLHSPLHIFCDGARRPADDAAVEETRQVVRAWPHPENTVHESPANRGLAASIIAGVTALCAQYGRVIVVEDDLVVAPLFLDFLNRGLETYADKSQVMQISGHMFDVELPAEGGDSLFLPFTTSWGWGTWRRAWALFDQDMKSFGRIAGDQALRRQFDLYNAYPYVEMLKKQRAGEIDSWAIRWYLSVFSQNGLVLYPRLSLVDNQGLDGSGTHGASSGNAKTFNLPDTALRIDTIGLAVDRHAFEAIGKSMRAARGMPRLAFDWLRRNITR